MKFSVQCLPAGFNIRDVEEVLVGSARKSNPDRLTNGRARPVTAGKVRSRARLYGSVAGSNLRDHAFICIFKAEELRFALDLDASSNQPLNQQTLVLVLRKDERVRIWADSHAHVT